MKKTIACLKCALELDGVISNSLVGRGTKPLSDDQKKIFCDQYFALQDHVKNKIDLLWQTKEEITNPQEKAEITEQTERS